MRSIVSRIAARLPKGQDVDDLIGEGTLGLIDALNRFDPERGVPFGAFARQRVRGAILDRLRAVDPLPRSARDLEDRRRALAGEGRSGAAAERSLQDAAVSDDGPRSILPAPIVVSLDALGAGAGDECASGEELLPAAKTDSPLSILLKTEQTELLKRVVAGLPERERLAMSLYYVEGLTMKEVGAVMGITESRVCQIHRSALARIRTVVLALTSVPEGRPRAGDGGGRVS